MKTFLTIIFFITSSVIFYSCKSDSPVEVPEGSSDYQWQKIDSLNTGESADNLFAYDENTLYIDSYHKTYKISGGVRTVVDYQDANFFPSMLKMYGSNYIACAGGRQEGSGPGTICLKISTGGDYTSVIIDTADSFQIFDMEIIEPGKIMFSSFNILYYYDNGIVTKIPFSSSNIFYRIVNSSGNIYVCLSSGFMADNVYKFENNFLTLLQTETNAYQKMKTDNRLIKSAGNGAATEVFYFQGTGWSQIFQDTKPRRYFSAAGENTNNMYLLSYDTTSGSIHAMTWNGSALARDNKYPAAELSTNTRISNMHSNVLFASVYTTDKIYIYKGRK